MNENEIKLQQEKIEKILKDNCKSIAKAIAKSFEDTIDSDNFSKLNEK
jgi:actin-like ATPase involved in cell morphogenesis